MKEQNLREDVRRYLATLHKRRGIFVSCVLTSVLIAAAYNYTTRPLYQATAQILIDVKTPALLPGQPITDADALSSGDLQTQYQLLASRALAEEVVQRIELQKSAEFQTGPLMSPWERFQRRFLGRAPASTVNADGIPLPPAAAAFRSRLTVEPRPGGRLVNLRFTAYDPRVAAIAVNTLAEAYVEQSAQTRYDASTQASGWLADRVREQQERLRAAERALLEFSEREGFVHMTERPGLVDQKLEGLAAALTTARTERIARETTFNQMRALPLAQLQTYPLVLENPVVQSLRSRTATLQAERARLSDSLGERHPDMIRLAAEMADTQDKLRAEAQATLNTVETQYRTSVNAEQRLEAYLEAAKAEVQDANRKSSEFGLLQREVESNKALLRELVDRNKQAGLETDLRRSSVRIVERAETPRAPVSPQHQRNYQLGLLVGLAAGLALVILVEHLDNTIKTPEDVKDVLGLPFLGMVPDVGARAPAAALRPGNSPLMVKAPSSATAEAYRVLRTSLIFASAQRKGRVLLVSSASPGEGKTTTVANLAVSIAMNGARVLTIDADLRRPVLNQHFGIPKTPGLTDLIVGKATAREGIHVHRATGVSVMPCGYIAPNPAELLGSEGMREVIAGLRTQYDWILIDTPPILGIADAPVLCPLVDGVVLVVGSEVSSRAAIQRAVEQIASVGGRVTGVVLNKVNLERNSYYYGQYYSEYYSSYYAEPRPSETPETRRGVS